jgi:ketosteroid isomerase-like protein
MRTTTKTCLASLVAILTIAACASAPAPAASTPTAAITPAASRRETQLAALDAIEHAENARDAHAATAPYADDAVVDLVGGRTLRGHAAIEGYLKEQMVPAAKLQVAFGRVWLKGDVAIVEGTFHATPAAAPDLTIGANTLSVLTFDRAGKVAHERHYQNQGTLDAQMDREKDAPPVPPLPATREVYAGDSPDDTARVAWAHGVEAAYTESDDKLLAAMDDRVTWRCNLGFNGNSKAEFAAPLARYRVAFPDLTQVADRVWPVEDFVIVEETLKATQKGKFGPFAASGRPIVWRWAEIWHVKDGKIARGWSYANFREVLPQLTGEPPKASKAKPPCSIEP